ncbi:MULTISPECIES: ABC transporter permease [unclassified Schlesneria]|uniref:ABC transporter permease n=1 Tax=unclassified Schlesneria TaxID=2762017 RepID=UPI002EF2BBA0
MSAWHITSKDLLLLFQDRRALVLLLILPLMFISIVGMSTGQLLTRDESTERFKIAVVDLDATETSHDLVADLSRKPELLITTVASESLGKELMARGDASLVLVIGDQFEERVEELSLSDIFNPKEALAVSGLSAIDLNVHMKPNSAGLGRLLEGVLRAQVIGFVAPITARKNPVTRAWVTPREETEDEAGMVGLVESESPKSSSKVNGVYLWVVPGFTVMFAFFVISIMARSFIIERDQGTLRRLMMAPINTVSVLLGKTVPFFLTSVLQCSLLFLCGRILFGMPWGNQPFYLIPVILSTSAAATALGLLLSTLVHTDQQVSSYGTTLILMFSSISGCFFPRELFPKAMRQISLVTPHAWSLKAFDAVLTQPVVDPQAVLMCCGMLLVFAAVFFTTGWWRFRLSAQG